MIKFFKTLFKFFGHDFFNMTYTLKENEIELWESIVKKAERGHQEFWEECEKDPNYISWAWMSPGLTKDEQELIRKIHEYFYPGDYIVDPIGVAQADYAWHNDIKNKVI